MQYLSPYESNTSDCLTNENRTSLSLQLSYLINALAHQANTLFIGQMPLIIAYHTGCLLAQIVPVFFLKNFFLWLSQIKHVLTIRYFLHHDLFTALIFMSSSYFLMAAVYLVVIVLIFQPGTRNAGALWFGSFKCFCSEIN